MSVSKFNKAPIWLIYALGGGMGHVMRALSLARYAARRKISTRILANSPFLKFMNLGESRLLRDERDFIELVAIPSHFDRAAIQAEIARQLSHCDQRDVLIVDTFPRGLAGELTNRLRDLTCLKVFIHRDLNEDYIQWGQLADCRHDFELIIVPGEPAPFESLADLRTEPWLICEPDELLPQSDARRLLNVSSSEVLPVILVSGCGTTAEAKGFAELAERIDREVRGRAIVRYASIDRESVQVEMELSVMVWPLLVVLPGADLLIGAGGYNTVYESRAIGVPLLAKEQLRLYDRQKRRLFYNEFCDGDDAILKSVRLWIEKQPQPKSSANPVYANGAKAAFDEIASRWIAREPQSRI